MYCLLACVPQLQGEGTQVQSIPVIQPPSLPVPLPPPMPASMVPTAPATQAQSLVNSKTKTALANMLSNRLNGGGGHHTTSTTTTTTTTTQVRGLCPCPLKLTDPSGVALLIH